MIYNALINVMGKHGEWKQSLKIFKLIKEKNLVPDTITCNYNIKTFHVWLEHNWKHTSAFCYKRINNGIV
jgi:pentatricopeptide repeat protein